MLMGPMQSDHPIINSRYLMHEAQQAHHFGETSYTRMLALIKIWELTYNYITIQVSHHTLP